MSRIEKRKFFHVVKALGFFYTGSSGSSSDKVARIGKSILNAFCLNGDVRFGFDGL